MAIFSPEQWRHINDVLVGNEAKFGLPKRQTKSVVLGSFNIQKFGKLGKRPDQAMNLIAKFCRRCDLIAIQEVQDDMASLLHLAEMLGASYKLIVSDITGGVPKKTRKGGSGGMTERLAFFNRKNRIAHTGLVSDVSFDRSAVFDHLVEHRHGFIDDIFDYLKRRHAATKLYDYKLKRWEDGGKQGKKPKKTSESPELNEFLTFIRTPHCASFKTAGGLEFLAVNAHLHWGDGKKERELEFNALMRWLVSRTQQVEKLFHKNLILLGDLNLGFAKSGKRRKAVEENICKYNKQEFYRQQTKINFPFIDVHNDMDEVFRTNVGRDETFDHISFFAHKRALPGPEMNKDAGKLGANGFDYGVFDYVRLFAEAILVKDVNRLTSGERKTLEKNAKDLISDHMPIWVRLEG